MAITTAWTTDISTTKLPAATVIPVVALLAAPVRAENFTIDLDGTTYDNAVGATSFAAIGVAVKAYVDTTYVGLLGLDAALAITGRIIIKSVIRRFPEFEPGNYANQYLASTNVFRVVATFQWKVS